MFKNENEIKNMIVKAHRGGTCDSNGESVKKDGRFIAKPRTMSSAAKTFICRDGKMVLKNG